MVGRTSIFIFHSIDIYYTFSMSCADLEGDTVWATQSSCCLLNPCGLLKMLLMHKGGAENVY